MSHSRFVKPGLTLIELVVVLSILAALTGVAVRSLEPIADQTRYEATRKTLDHVRDAIITLPAVRRGDGSLAMQGFVSDMGRLPRTLDELLVKPINEADPTKNIFEFAANTDFGVQAVAGLTEGLPCGWRGPYLQTTSITTGWGTGFIQNTSNPDPQDTARLVLDAIHTIQPGSTNVLAIPSEFNPTNTTVNTLRDHAYVDVSVTFAAPPARTPTLYIPNANAGDLKAITEDATVSTPTLKVFRDVPIGVRLIEESANFKYIDVTPGMAPVPF
ncbi:MAG: prepilin-type N-terminal cleavage/methylation domain-containing protein [Planctomycetota bacterium]